MNEIVFSGNRPVKLAETGDSVFRTDMETIEKIIYHTPCGPGDAHFVDVFYTDGEVHRIFEPDCVVWDE